MKIYASKTEIFIRYNQRSVDIYYPQLSEYIRQYFAVGTYEDEKTVMKIIECYYGWCSGKFQKIISQIDDMKFVYYLFAYHESSIQLWMRVINAQDLEEQFEISHEELALNRRIFKLALEQACDVNYTQSREPTKDLFQQYDLVIEDLLYIGTEMYKASGFLAEFRMIPGAFTAIIKDGEYLHINRKGENEAIIGELHSIMDVDFAKGIVDSGGAAQLKTQIKKCFGIDYDFAASLIVQIKKHLSPVNWEYQTIEKGILIENLLRNGVSQQNAENFYQGLTLSRENKQSIMDSIYKVNSMERYFSRPILELAWKGERRHLIGIQKWAESITVLATNNFQWDKAPVEWKQNECFQKYLNQKSDEHDVLLENEVQKILESNQFPFQRNVHSFGKGKHAKSVEVVGVGEMDFVWIDTARKKIVLADCKYNRARYDMISFSADNSTFRNSYEKKIANKAKWIGENRELVQQHFDDLFPDQKSDISRFAIEELFIINTPTLYMYLNRTNTVCWFNLEEFIYNEYKHPDIIIKVRNGKKTSMKVKTYPYLSL